MSSQTERVKALLQDLKQDTEHYQRLEQLLEQQREAMFTCNAGRTTEIDNELMSLYPLLQNSARRRADTLTGFTLSPDGRGLVALFSRLPAVVSQQATAWWEQLEQQALLCKQLNQRNGLLLNSQQEVLGTLLYHDPQDFIYSR